MHSLYKISRMHVRKKTTFVSLSARMFCLAILLSNTFSYENAQEQSVDVVRERVCRQHTHEHFYLNGQNFSTLHWLSSQWQH
jgi:hypothetical protein